MARCAKCSHACHDQFQGHKGRWLCMHPYRSEIDNSGNFTYPGNHAPAIRICETPASAFGNNAAHMERLVAAKTPKWCYYEVVERERKINPGFDPEKQRAILWPQKIKKEK